MDELDIKDRYKAVNELAKLCGCCNICGPRPCDGVMAGGLCDGATCICDDEEYWDTFGECN